MGNALQEARKAASADAVSHVYLSSPDDVLKYTEQDDGTIQVFGVASSPRLDLDQQIADPAWLKSALPEWMQYGNVREMHGATAAGVGLALDHGAGDKWSLRSHVVDDNAVKKVKAGVYKGYSIGIKGARVVTDPMAPKGRIVGGTIVEVSLVDRPANPDSMLTIAKMHGADLAPVSIDGAHYEPDAEPAGNPLGGVTAKRAEMVPEPPDGPLADEMTSEAPAETAEPAIVTEVFIPRQRTAPPEDLSLRDYRKTVRLIEDIERGDLTQDLLKAAGVGGDADAAKDVIASIARLIISEATELAAGNCDELDDIDQLCRAAYAMRSFMQGEQAETPGDADVSYVGLAAQPETIKRDFSQGKRKKLAKTGAAMPDGSFPIQNGKDLANAIGLAGNAKDPDAARAHIKARAAALGLSDQIPDTWKSGEADLTKASTVDTGSLPHDNEDRTTEIVKAAVTEATDALKAQLATVQADLVKVQSMPIPGGPMITNAAYHAPVTAKAAGPDKGNAAYWRQLADKTSDPGVKTAYLAQAARLGG